MMAAKGGDMEAVIQYAKRFADKAERIGRGTEFPTIRQAAKRFGLLQSDVVEAVEDAANVGVDGFDYIGLGVGVSTGTGYGVHDNVGDYVIEAYRVKPSGFTE